MSFIEQELTFFSTTSPKKDKVKWEKHINEINSDGVSSYIRTKISENIVKDNSSRICSYDSS